MEILVTIGHRMAYIGQGALIKGMAEAWIKHYQSREISLPHLKKHIGQQEVVLFKGSEECNWRYWCKPSYPELALEVH